MKANMRLAVSMLSLILLTFFRDVMPSHTGSSTNDPKKTTSMIESISTATLANQSTDENGVTSVSTTLSVKTNEPSQTPISRSTGPKTTTKSMASQTSTSSPTNKFSTMLSMPSKHGTWDVGSTVIVVIVVILLLILLLGLIYKWATRKSDQEGSAPQLLLGVRERLRGGVRTLEERLGLSLRPGKRPGDEEDGEGEEEGVDREEGKRDDDGAGAGGASAGKMGEDEDCEDSSDDYSSLEGVDLRERAKNLEDKEKKEAAATRNSGSAAGPDDTSEESDETDEEQERTGVTSGEEENKGEMCDLTIL